MAEVHKGVDAAVVDEKPIDRPASSAALARLLVEWDARLGPLDEAIVTWASAAFDDVDGVAVADEA